MQNPTIYKIDKSHWRIREIRDTKDIIKTIISHSYLKLGLKSIYEDRELRTTKIENTLYYLYLFNTEEIESDWINFFPVDLVRGGNFKQQKLSLILFVESYDELFCTVGGSAFQIVVPFIDRSFGLNIYSRIIRPDKDELASIKSRGITGTRVGMNEQFRGTYRIIDFIKFGKIPQEIHIKLAEETSAEYLSFLQNKPNERIQIYVSKGIKIKKTFDFDALHRIIDEIISIYGLEESDYLSSYKEITDKQYISEYLDSTLMDKLFNDIQNVIRNDIDLLNRFEFDFCNPNNIEYFYEADSYFLKEKTSNGGYFVFKKLYNREEIYAEVIKRAVDTVGDSDIFQFKIYLQGVIVTCNKNKMPPKSAPFLKHFSAEFKIDGKPIFLVDTRWYYLRDSFINDLKTHSVQILKAYKCSFDILDLPWDKRIIKKEKTYNLLYKDRQNYIVLDTLISDGIELCDIIHYNEENLYLIHVKYGFKAEVRELTNQILLSAKRLKEALGSPNNSSFLSNIFKQVVRKEHSTISESEFLDLFNRKITFVMGFTSHLKEDTIVEKDIDAYESNIARFSLIQCSSEMRSSYYDMLTCQIGRV